jgi:hypothetical protein
MFGTFFFDLYKWLIFIVSSENLEGSTAEAGFDNERHRKVNNIERKTKILNIVLIVSQVIIKIAFIVTIVGYCSGIKVADEKERKDIMFYWVKFRSRVVMTLSIIFLVVYSIAFYMLN